MTAVAGSWRIDAHQHVWNLDRARYDWLDGSSHLLGRSFDFDEAEPWRTEAAIDGTILVQAADNADDSANMLAVADRHPQVVGIVAWLAIDESSDQVEAALAAITRDPRVVGVRTLIHDRADPTWIVTAAKPGLAALAERDLPYDYVTSSPHALAHVPTILEQHPRLRVVVDHLGKPPIGGTRDERSRWRSLLRDVASHPDSAAKVSGLYPAAGGTDTSAADIRPFFDDAVELFGASRLMFGSDWPLSLLAGGPERIWRTALPLLDGLPAADRDAVLGATAAGFYRIPVERLEAGRAARVSAR